MTKRIPKVGDPVRIKGSYYINKSLDLSHSLRNKIGLVLSVKSFGERALFGEYYLIEGFCCGEIFQAYLEDIEVLKK